MYSAAILHSALARGPAAHAQVGVKQAKPAKARASRKEEKEQNGKRKAKNSDDAEEEGGADAEGDDPADSSSNDDDGDDNEVKATWVSGLGEDGKRDPNFVAWRMEKLTVPATCPPGSCPFQSAGCSCLIDQGEEVCGLAHRPRAGRTGRRRQSFPDRRRGVPFSHAMRPCMACAAQAGFLLRLFQQAVMWKQARRPLALWRAKLSKHPLQAPLLSPSGQASILPNTRVLRSIVPHCVTASRPGWQAGDEG